MIFCLLNNDSVVMVIDVKITIGVIYDFKVLYKNRVGWIRRVFTKTEIEEYKWFSQLK